MLNYDIWVLLGVSNFYINMRAGSSFILFFICYGILAASFSRPLNAQETRAFTNKEGVEIQAALIEIVDNTNVRIKRASDGREFLLEIVSLDLDDQQYLVNFLKGDIGREALKVKVPNCMDRILPVTDRISWVSSMISGNVARLPIPMGTWVSYYSYDISGRFLIQYQGAKNWEIKVSADRTVWLVRDNRKAELIGACLPSHESGEDSECRKLLQSIDEKKVKNVFSLTCRRSEDLKLVSLLSNELPLAVVPVGNIRRSELQLLSEKNLVALHTEIDFDYLSELKNLPKLKCLTLKIEKLEPQDIITFLDMPQLEHLALIGSSGQVKWIDSLISLPNLRSLSTFQIGDELVIPDAPILSFDKNPNLNFLVIGTRKSSYITMNAIASAGNLQYLKFDGSIRGLGSSNELGLSNLKKLRYLYLSSSRFSEQMDKEFESGALANLRDLLGFYIPRFKYCPKLEALSVFRTTRYSIDYSRLDSAPSTLQQLVLVGASIDQMKNLNLPNPEALKYLAVASSDVSDVQTLYRFPNLVYLRSYKSKFSRLDLNFFPYLQRLALDDLEKLESVRGLSDQSHLTYLRLTNLPTLTDFGIPLPNQSIRSIDFTNLPMLTSLEPFEQLTSCRRLSLRDCDALDTFAAFDKGNDLIRLFVRDCEKMADFSRYPKN